MFSIFHLLYPDIKAQASTPSSNNFNAKRPIVMTILFSSRNEPSTAYIPSTLPKRFTTHPQHLPLKTSTTSLSHRSSKLVNTHAPRFATASIATPHQQVREYTKADRTAIETLSSSLASAFESDPVFGYIHGSTGSEAVAIHKRLFSSLLNLELSRPNGQTTIHVSDDDSTVAMWHHVGHWELPSSMAILFLLTLIRTLGWRAFRFLNTLGRVEEAHPKEPHMHLFVIGTHADGQGKGNGSRVISKMLRYCDSQRIAAYLESSNERNLSFYEKHGFKVVRKIPNMPEGCPPLFAMWRDPKPVDDDLQQSESTGN